VDTVRALVAEAVGSAFLVYVAIGLIYAGGIMSVNLVTSGRLFYQSIGYGFAFAALLYCFSFPSADRRVLPNMRHLNPALTLALFLSGKMSLTRTLLYWAAQVSGAGVGAFCVYFGLPLQHSMPPYAVIDVVSVHQEWLSELLASTVFVLVLLVTSFSHLGKQPSLREPVRETQAPQTQHEVNSIIAGAALFCSSAMCGVISGGYVNPLLALAAVITSGAVHVGPFVTPFLGATLAVLIGHIFGFRIQIFDRYFSSSRLGAARD
jgi:glycerol uptake facilitator-like aquaporin